MFHMFRRIDDDDLPAKNTEGIDAGAIIFPHPIVDEAMTGAQNDLEEAGILGAWLRMRRNEIICASFFNDGGRLIETKIHECVR